jgi:hypothetical protein|tara:strand:- start:39745 stop:39876 length:132 start_codon:yes stop_codon:yes gene_type:complete
MALAQKFQVDGVELGKEMLWESETKYWKSHVVAIIAWIETDTI